MAADRTEVAVRPAAGGEATWEHRRPGKARSPVDDWSSGGEGAGSLARGRQRAAAEVAEATRARGGVGGGASPAKKTPDRHPRNRNAHELLSNEAGPVSSAALLHTHGGPFCLSRLVGVFTIQP